MFRNDKGYFREKKVYIMSDEGREINLFEIKSNECCVISASCIINKNNFKFVDTTYETDTYYVDKKGTFIDKRICLRTRKTNDEKLELTYKPETNDETEKYGKKED